MRMVLAAMAVPTMAAGMMKNPRLRSGASANDTCSSGGCHCHQMEGNTTTSMPSQKLGVASPMIAAERPT